MIVFSSLVAPREWSGKPKVYPIRSDLLSVIMSFMVILFLTLYIGPELYTVLLKFGLSSGMILIIICALPPFIIPLIYFTGLCTLPLIKRMTLKYTVYYLTEDTVEIEVRLYFMAIRYSLPLSRIKNVNTIETRDFITVDFNNPIIHWWDFMGRYRHYMGEPKAADTFTFIGLDKITAYSLLRSLKNKQEHITVLMKE